MHTFNRCTTTVQFLNTSTSLKIFFKYRVIQKDGLNWTVNNLRNWVHLFNNPVQLHFISKKGTSFARNIIVFLSVSSHTVTLQKKNIHFEIKPYLCNNKNMEFKNSTAITAHCFESHRNCARYIIPSSGASVIMSLSASCWVHNGKHKTREAGNRKDTFMLLNQKPPNLLSL